jgi:hypothetical protein
MANLYHENEINLANAKQEQIQLDIEQSQVGLS